MITRLFGNLGQKNNMGILHTYGDSHASHHGGWSDINIKDLQIRQNHLGPKLMFTLNDKDINIHNVVRVTDYLIFCFGEIDCRCHVGKYKPNTTNNIDNLVTSYINTIKVITRNHDPSKVLIYNVVPPLERELEENLWMVGKSALPTVGTDEEIKNYTLYMNKKLKELSNDNSFIFFDVYNKYTNDKGFLTKELSDGNCHIKNPIYIQELLINILGK